MFVTLVTLRFCCFVAARCFASLRCLYARLARCFVNVFRKVSIFSGKIAKRNSANYKPPGNLIEAIIAAGRLLLLSHWPHYVPNKGRCTRAECTAMNAMAETIALAATAKAAKAAKRRSG